MNTGAARIPTVLEMTEDNRSFLCIWGGKKNWLPVHFTNTEPNTLMDVLGKQWLQNLPGHEEADRKHREQP